MNKIEYLAAVTNPAHSFTCEHCGKTQHRRLGGNSTKNRFCNHACRSAQAEVSRQLKREEERGLVLMRRLSRMLESFPPKEKERPVYQCSSCNMAYTRDKGQSKTICSPCVQMKAEQYRRAYKKEYRKTEVGKALKKAEKTKRRAKENAVIHKVKPKDIFERDKWTCQLCGIKTPRKLRAAYVDNAPELDHIITLAEGGDHTYANLQCACRRCNMLKGSRSKGQLGLDLT